MSYGGIFLIFIAVNLFPKLIGIYFFGEIKPVKKSTNFINHHKAGRS